MSARLFISYSHIDERHIEKLHKHLAQLEREGVVSGWFDRQIEVGGNLEASIASELQAADIFLACASPDYLASEYCYEKELQAALIREAAGTLIIAPVILEPCEWLKTPLQKFKAVPTDGKPVSEFTNSNVAFLNVVTELRRMAENKSPKAEFKSSGSKHEDKNSSDVGMRYRVKRDHDELHKRDFVEQSFQEIFQFFGDSAREISAIPDIEVRLSENKGGHFQCTVLNRGLKRAFETLHVRTNGSFGAIDILYGEENSRNTSHGGFSVNSDQYNLYFNQAMFSHGREGEKLTAKDVAQYLWDDLLSKVGIDYA